VSERLRLACGGKVATEDKNKKSDRWKYLIIVVMKKAKVCWWGMK